MSIVKQRDCICIVNPLSGNGHGLAMVPELKERLAANGIAATIAYTERQGHATELAADHVAKGGKRVFAIGGDGTFNEVAQALVGHPEVIFGPIPAGTGNDFIPLTGFAGRFSEEDWQTFFRQETMVMDVGCCNGRYFINGMGLGFDAYVASENYRRESEANAARNETVKKEGGKNKYFWHIIKTLMTYREDTVVIHHQGRIESRRILLNSIGNGRRMAAGLFLTPKALANDGLLDICMIRKLSIPGRMHAFSRINGKGHLGARWVEYLQTDAIRYEFSREVPAHVDGELIQSRVFDISVLPAAIRIVYNPRGEHYFRTSVKAEQVVLDEVLP